MFDRIVNEIVHVGGGTVDASPCPRNRGGVVLRKLDNWDTVKEMTLIPTPTYVLMCVGEGEDRVRTRIAYHDGEAIRKLIAEWADV